MQLLKQSTATTLIVGPVLDSTGAAVTTAVLGDFKIAKNGTTATLSGATVTHDANGYYAIALTTTNTDTTGRLTIYSGNTAQSMATHRYSVLLASVFDALITNATTAAGGLGDIQRLAGQAITAASGVTFPASIASPTNITSASGVTLAAATHTGAVIPTVTSVTNAVTLPASASINITGNITGNISGSVGSVTGSVGSVTSPVTAGTVSDKTGYSLVAVTGLGNQTANITGNISGSVGSVTSPVTVGTNNDKTGYSLSSAAIQAIWDALTSALSTVGSVGKLLVDNINATISSRASQTSLDGKPTLTQIEASTVLAKDATVAKESTLTNRPTLTQIEASTVLAKESTVASKASQTSVDTVASYIDTEVAAIKTVTDKVSTMLVQDGAVYQYTVNALENGPGGSGSTPPINVYPVTASTPERVSGTTLTFYLDESRSVSVLTDFTLTSLTLEFVVEDSRGNDVYSVADGSISRNDKTATIPITTTVTANLGQYNWSLRDKTSGNSVIARGVLTVQNAASAEVLLP